MPDYLASILNKREEIGHAENVFREGSKEWWQEKACQKITWHVADLSRAPWGNFLRVMQHERGRDTGKKMEDNRAMEVPKGRWGSLCQRAPTTLYPCL